MERLGLLVEPAMLPITIIPKHEVMPPLLHEEGWRGVEGKGSRRGLQTSCAEGDSFAITSSAFPLMEGCVLYSGLATADGNLVYSSSSAIVLSVSNSTTTTDGSAEAYWVVAEILDDDSSDVRCFSNETSTALPYPVEATWICDVDGDSELDLPTSSEFSTSCDCSTTTVTTTDSDTGTPTTTTDTTTSATCNEGGSFTVASTVFPELVGCYLDTGTLNENEVVYTETGTADVGQNGVAAVNIEEDSAQDIRWIVAYSSLDTTSRESEIYCISTELATNVHPVDVTSWTCDLSGGGSETSDVFLLSDPNFITCGCTSGGEQNPNVGHLSTTLSTFVAVGVGFTATVVHLVRL